MLIRSFITVLLWSGITAERAASMFVRGGKKDELRVDFRKKWNTFKALYKTVSLRSGLNQEP